jgi:hypothetical protein
MMTLKFILKFYFFSLFFLAIRWPVLIIFKKYILISNFIFFSSFLNEEKDGPLNSSLEREN